MQFFEINLEWKNSIFAYNPMLSLLPGFWKQSFFGGGHYFHTHIQRPLHWFYFRSFVRGRFGGSIIFFCHHPWFIGADGHCDLRDGRVENRFCFSQTGPSHSTRVPQGQSERVDALDLWFCGHVYPGRICWSVLVVFKRYFKPDEIYCGDHRLGFGHDVFYVCGAPCSINWLLLFDHVSIGKPLI